MSKILLVEDNALAAIAACSILEEVGHIVETTATGQQALERYKSGFDLILMDIGLPDMNGMAVTRAIRLQEEHNKRVLIIALTAHEEEGAKAAALEAGMDGLISKPLDADKLMALMSAMRLGSSNLS